MEFSKQLLIHIKHIEFWYLYKQVPIIDVWHQT